MESTKTWLEKPLAWPAPELTNTASQAQIGLLCALLELTVQPPTPLRQLVQLASTQKLEVHAPHALLVITVLLVPHHQHLVRPVPLERRQELPLLETAQTAQLDLVVLSKE